MRTAMKSLVVGVVALTSLSAHAYEAQLATLNVRAFFHSGNLRSLRLVDGNVLRTTSILGSRFSWTVSAESNHTPSEVQRIQVQLRGQKSAGRTVTLSLFNYQTNAWERHSSISLPSASSGLSDVYILSNARRFVSNTGTIQVRYEASGFCNMVTDRLMIAVNP